MRVSACSRVKTDTPALTDCPVLLSHHVCTGKGAFGRVLLAEAKTDGKLYALKIISKKNMGQGDRRQAMAERDILHAMSHASPHPFTTGQSHR